MNPELQRDDRILDTTFKSPFKINCMEDFYWADEQITICVNSRTDLFLDDINRKESLKGSEDLFQRKSLM